MPLTVAIDAGPLHGPRTGIGNAVAWTIDAFARRLPISNSEPYVTSMRARVRSPQRRLPIPAAVALRLWARRSPPVDRFLGHPDVVHGTNYVVPPTQCPRLVTVYDCWFLDHPADALPDVRRAAAVLRRAVADGAHVVTSSDATSRRSANSSAPTASAPSCSGHHRSTCRRRRRPPPSIRPAPSGLPDLTSAPFILAVGTTRTTQEPDHARRGVRASRARAPERQAGHGGRRGNDADAVNRRIARLDPAIAERVIRTGPVDDLTKRWLLQHARALAYPSLDEGFGFPILEAQLLGTPVVASTAGSIPQIAGAAALLSPAHDAEALAANLYWIVSNDEMYAKLVRRGHTNVTRFSWTSTARQLQATYHELADGIPVTG